MSDTQATARLMYERFSYAAALESAWLAERVGFEPTVPLTVHKLSKPAPRTWRHAQLFLSIVNPN